MASMNTYKAVLFAVTLSSTGGVEEERGAERGGTAWMLTVVAGRRTSLRTVKWRTDGEGGREGGRKGGCKCHGG